MKIEICDVCRKPFEKGDTIVRIKIKKIMPIFSYMKGEYNKETFKWKGAICQDCIKKLRGEDPNALPKPPISGSVVSNE